MADGPQVVDDQVTNAKYIAPEQVVPSSLNQTYSHVYDSAVESGQNDSKSLKRTEHQTVCGIRRCTFWILVVSALLVIGITIGGSVGGTLAVQDSR